MSDTEYPIFVIVYEELPSGDYKDVFDYYTHAYPHYHKGDTLWLETEVNLRTRFQQAETKKLTGYEIIEVSHSATKSFGVDSIDTYLKVEVSVRKKEK